MGLTSNQKDKPLTIDLSEHLEQKKLAPNTDLQEQTVNKPVTEAKNKLSTSVETKETLSVNKDQSDTQEVMPNATENTPIIEKPIAEKAPPTDNAKTVHESNVIDKQFTEHRC